MVFEHFQEQLQKMEGEMRKSENLIVLHTSHTFDFPPHPPTYHNHWMSACSRWWRDRCRLDRVNQVHQFHKISKSYEQHFFKRRKTRKWSKMMKNHKNRQRSRKCLYIEGFFCHHVHFLAFLTIDSLYIWPPKNLKNEVPMTLKFLWIWWSNLHCLIYSTHYRSRPKNSSIFLDCFWWRLRMAYGDSI